MNKRPLYQPNCECPCTQSSAPGTQSPGTKSEEIDWANVEYGWTLPRVPSPKSLAPGPYSWFTSDVASKCFELGAKCAEDELEEEVNQQLAYLDKRVTKLEEAAAKPQFKTGDRILYGNHEEPGVLVEYPAGSPTYAKVQIDGESYIYVVPIKRLKAAPTAPTAKFKAGDRVIGKFSGRHGVIRSLTPSGYFIDWDNGGETSNAVDTNLELEPVVPSPRFEVGDRVMHNFHMQYDGVVVGLNPSTHNIEVKFSNDNKIHWVSEAHYKLDTRPKSLDLSAAIKDLETHKWPHTGNGYDQTWNNAIDTCIATLKRSSK